MALPWLIGGAAVLLAGAIAAALSDDDEKPSNNNNSDDEERRRERVERQRLEQQRADKRNLITSSVNQKVVSVHAYAVDTLSDWIEVGPVQKNVIVSANGSNLADLLAHQVTFLADLDADSELIKPFNLLQSISEGQLKPTIEWESLLKDMRLLNREIDAFQRAIEILNLS